MKSTAELPTQSERADSPLIAAERTQPRFSPLQLILLLRPKQWSKNLLVFAAPLFTGSITQAESLIPALLAFASLCLASSSIYVLNDLLDVERDRRHPKKSRRPLASGAVPIWMGIAAVPVLLGGTAVLALLVNTPTVAVVMTYLGLHTLYNLGAKHTALADVFAIALGFVLRAVVGAAAINVTISGWLLFCTGALALMLGFGKRRQEFISQGEDRTLTRESLGHYSLQGLDALVMMSACAAALCYGIYSIESETARHYPALVLTTVPVFYGISRYVLLVFGNDEGGEPETLLFSDRHILLSVVLFVFAVMFAMSGIQIPFLEAGK